MRPKWRDGASRYDNLLIGLYFLNYPYTEAPGTKTSQKTGADMDFHQKLAATRMVPVIVIKQLGHAIAPAKALVEGTDSLEITLHS